MLPAEALVDEYGRSVCGDQSRGAEKKAAAVSEKLECIHFTTSVTK